MKISGKKLFINFFIFLFLGCTKILASYKPIRVLCIITPKYQESWNKGILRLKSELENQGLLFVEDDPDVIFCNEVSQELLKKNIPIIILERDSTKLKKSTRKMLNEKNVKAVFKNLVLNPLTLYNGEACMGKYHFKLINDYAKFHKSSYEQKISDNNLKKIVCVPWDLHLSNFTSRLVTLKQQQLDFMQPRTMDVFFAGYTHFDRASESSNRFYRWHREKAISAIKDMKNIQSLIAVGRPFAFNTYIENMKNAKIVVSPWGFSEWCFRDGEAILCGAVLIKPDSDFVTTVPNIYKNNKTYVACKPDFSDLKEKIGQVLNNYDSYEIMRKNAYELFMNETDESLLVKYIVKKIKKALDLEGAK